MSGHLWPVVVVYGVPYVKIFHQKFDIYSIICNIS